MSRYSRPRRSGEIPMTASQYLLWLARKERNKPKPKVEPANDNEPPVEDEDAHEDDKE